MGSNPSSSDTYERSGNSMNTQESSMTTTTTTKKHRRAGPQKMEENSQSPGPGTNQMGSGSKVNTSGSSPPRH